MSNQQGVAKPAADHQPGKSGGSPADSKTTPEKTYTQAEFDRVDTARRSLQTKYTALEKTHKELQATYDTVFAENEAHKVALSENYTEETLRNAVREHVKERAETIKIKRQADAKSKAAEEIVAEAAEEKLSPKRQQLITDFGCPPDVLEGITDPDEMERIAWKNKTKMPDAKPVEGENQDAKGSGGNGTKPVGSMPILPGDKGGPSLKDLSPDQRVAEGLSKLKK